MTDMSPKSNIPEWMESLSGAVAGMFFLDAWIIRLHSHVDRPEGHESSDGLNSFNTRYMTSDIYLDTRLDPESKYGHEVVVHEILHLVTAEMRDVVAHIIDLHITEDEREALQDLYERAEERLITVLARGMSKRFDLDKWCEKEKSE